MWTPDPSPDDTGPRTGGGVDLDDESALRTADATGALLHSAMAGAQVRAVAAAVESGALAGLTGLRPRAVVWLTGRSAAPRHAAAVVTALASATGGHGVPPVVCSRVLPAWTGPLDVVVVSGNDPGDPELAAAVDTAGRRGATVVVDLPPEGPIRSAADSDTRWLPPLPHLPTHRGLMHHAAAGMATLGVLGADRVDLAAAADAVDDEIAGSAPVIATPVNPAKLLALSVAAEPAPRWVHGDPVAEAVSARAVAAFADAGRLTASVTVSDELRASAERAAVSGRAEEADRRLFHDELLDGTWKGSGARRLGMVCQVDAERIRAAAEPLADLEWVTGRGLQTAGRVADDNGKVLALMARIEMAAAYFLVGGL